MERSITNGSGEDRYLSLDQVAGIAGVHKATVYRWLADPALSLRDRVLRLPGGRIRILESEFRAWIETQNTAGRATS